MQTPPDYLMRIPVSGPGGQTQYQQTAPLLQALDWLLSNPSIPLSFRNQFYVLWENAVFGNFGDRDVQFLMSKFREWKILLLWYIPEQRWGNIHEFKDENGQVSIRMDLNMLLNTLESLYYIQLTRGKEGFTVKELTTFRSVGTIRSETSEQKKGGIRLF